MVKLAASVGVVWLLVGGSAQAADCTEADPCTTTLHATKKAKTWRTPEAFGRLEHVTFDADVGERDLAWLQEGCAGYFTGAGVSLYLAGDCKRRAPFKITYMGYRGPKDITLRYWTD